MPKFHSDYDCPLSLGENLFVPGAVPIRAHISLREADSMPDLSQVWNSLMSKLICCQLCQDAIDPGSAWDNFRIAAAVQTPTGFVRIGHLVSAVRLRELLGRDSIFLADGS